MQYFNDGDVGNVQILYCQNILEHVSSTNAQTISDLSLESVTRLHIEKLTWLLAAVKTVMVGKRGCCCSIAAFKMSKSYTYTLYCSCTCCLMFNDAPPYPYGNGKITVLNNLCAKDYQGLVNVLGEGRIKHVGRKQNLSSPH